MDTPISLSRHRPLGLVDGSVLTYRPGSLFLCGRDLEPFRSLGKIPRTRIKYMAEKAPMMRRLLRLEPTDAVAIHNRNALVNMHGRLLIVDLDFGQVKIDFTIPQGRKALRLRRIEGVPGFQDCVMFGDYFPNPEKGKLSLWRRPLSPEGQWSVAVEIPAGTANHVHDVVPDPFRGCLWVLTGDFDQAPGLWRLTPDLELEPVFRGSQQDRAAALFVTSEALYYATDTPLERNHLYRVDQAESEPVRAVVAELPGSVIYGEVSDGEYFFATTVEPGLPTGSRWRDWSSRRRGPGIGSDRAHLYRLQPSGQLSELGSAPKDRWPMVPFQFGSFHICPAPGGGAFASGVALKGGRRALGLPSARKRKESD